MCNYQEWKYIAQGDECMWGKECYCKHPKGDTFCNSFEQECELLDEKSESDNQ